MNQANVHAAEDKTETGYDDRYGRLNACLNHLVDVYRSRNPSGVDSIEDYVIAARRLVQKGHDPTTVTVAAMSSMAAYLNDDLSRWQSRVAEGSFSETPCWEEHNGRQP